jgi:uncharacterized delta-60 repeat protein
MSSKPREIRAVRNGAQPFDDLKPIRAPAATLAGLAATLLTLTGNLVAAPGDLDPNFNGSGLLFLAQGRPSAVAQQTDGKLVLAGFAGDFDADGFFMMVARVAEDGTLDSTFDSDGVAFPDFPGLGASAVIQQTDGKLVLAGTSSSDVALARFNADGTLDASFGNGGKATLDIGGNVDHARGLIEQPGGKYVIAGETIAAGGLYQLVFARFNADGTLDTSFGTGGTTLVDIGRSGTESGGLAQQADGKLVAVGSISGPTGLDVGIVRVTADGALDLSFDGDGLLTVDINDIDQAFAVAIQPDHAIVVAGVTAPDAGIPFNALLLRVNGDGSVDNSFGAGALPDTILNSIVVQEDGKLVATGARDTNNEVRDLILTRFNSDGALDISYGVDGVATADFGAGGVAPFSSGSALIRQTDGKYVAAGSIGAARFDDGAAFAGRIGLTLTSQDVLETTPTVTYTVRRTGGRTGAVNVNYATAAGQAQPGSDFENVSGTLTWNDGDASDKTLTINLINDSVAEADEGFTLSLSTPTGGAHLAASEAATTILSSDGLGELRLCVDFCFGGTTDAVTEADTVYEGVSVVRTGGSTGAVSVVFSTTGETATPGMDYTETTGTLNWDDGETLAKFISVPILDDAVAEGYENFQINLSDPTGGATIRRGSQSRVIVQIDDNDPGLGFTSSTATIGEAEGSVSLTVSRTGGSGRALSVNYATSSGSATEGTDFTAASGTLDWADRDTADKTITVDVPNDTAEETSENFTVTLSNPSGGAQLRENNTIATVTIADDDAPPPPTGGGGGGTLGFELLALLGLLNILALRNARLRLGAQSQYSLSHARARRR